MQASDTMPSSALNSSCFGCRSSTIASTTTWQGLSAASASTISMRASAASASAWVMRPFCAMAARDLAIASFALAAAPGWASNTSVRTPHWASTCTMPRPMVPLPATPATRSGR